MRVGNIKQLIAILLYTMFILFFLYKGAFWEHYLKHVSNYSFFPRFVMISLIPVLAGVLFALPGLIKKLKHPGKLYFNWVMFIAMGLPLLYVTISPYLYFSPIGKYLPGIGMALMSYSSTPLVICAAIFGYLTISLFDMKTE